MTYKQNINRQAYNVINKLPDMPDYHLMIGDAEELKTVPVLVAKTYVPKYAVKTQADISTATDDEISFMLENNIIEVNDLNANVMSIGEGLGGI